VIFLAFLRMRHVRDHIAADETIEDDALPTDSFLLALIAALFALLATFAVHVG
jgi:putative membrane protein